MAILGGLAAAAFFATATLCSSRSTRMVPPASVLAWVMITGLVVLLPALAVVDVPSPDGAQVGWLLVSGAGNVVGLLLAYSALREGKVSVVAPVVSTEGAVAAVASVAAGERLQVGAALLLPVIVVGVVLAATGPTTDLVAADDGRRAPRGRCCSPAPRPSRSARASTPPARPAPTCLCLGCSSRPG